jgi:hypothetical protein
MTKEKIYTKFGITSCPNPQHYYQFGKTTVVWRWAADYWTTVSEEECYDEWISFSRFRMIDGFRGGKIVIWKFLLFWGEFGLENSDGK